MPEASPSATVVEKRRFDARDFDYIAQFIWEELKRRQTKRKDMEEQWKEIDRQLAMTPDAEYKKDRYGRPKLGMKWIPEIELPLQAQTLEILCADSKRMIFPDNGPFYRAHAMMSDEYLRSVDFKSLISGMENDVPSLMNQDNADRIVEGIMGFVHEQGNFYHQWDRFNAEAFKYGTGIGRVRKAKKSVYFDTARGTAREDLELPIFFPVSIKSTYLDDTEQLVMSEGHVLGPAVIFYKMQKLTDIVMAAQKGSKDTDNEDGGWMPAKLKDIEPDANGMVEVLRYEGDLIVERKTVDNIYLPGALVTVLVAGGKPKVVRLAFRDKPFSSYVAQPYHSEDITSPYGVGPLMKGAPLQKAASQMMVRLLMSAILNTEPPVKYDPEDSAFASTGGPVIEPRALWGSTGDVEAVKIGDPGQLMQLYIAMVQHYSDVTGMHAPRLGQQTVSHTTAYAKQAELSQGQVRTVDYVNSLLDGGMSRVLDMQFAHLRDVWSEEKDIWIPDFSGYCRIFKDVIPPDCAFEVFGSAGPSEQRARQQDQMAALQQVIQIDMLKMQLAQASGQPSKQLDYENLQRTILKGVGFADVDALFAASPPASPALPPPVGPGVPEPAAGDSGTATAALQALAFGPGTGG